MTLKNQWLKKPSVKTEELIELYKQGLTTTQIGEKVGLFKSSVGKRLKKAGIVLRKNSDYTAEKRTWAWKGKSTLLDRKRFSQHHQRWSKAVRERDGNVCKDCNRTSGRLHAHHIVPLEVCLDSSLEFDVDNGVTLCPKCHKKRHKKSKT